MLQDRERDLVLQMSKLNDISIQIELQDIGQSAMLVLNGERTHPGRVRALPLTPGTRPVGMDYCL